MDVWIQLVSSLGVPAAMCFFMMQYIEKQEERHQAEVAGLRDAVNNNTIVVTKLVERLGGVDDE